MLHIDLKYVHLLSCHFERFTRKGDYLFNVRCPLCGDSQEKKTKMRGYIYRSKQRLAYKCHNCNQSMWFRGLLKYLAPDLYKEYSIEVLKELRPGLFKLAKLMKEPGFFDGPTTQIRFGTVEAQIFQHAEKISDLPDGHYCRQYVQDRLIPRALWSKLYYAEHYKDFLDEVAPGHEKTIKNDARLVIPYYDAYGVITAVTGRALADGRNVIRYVTVRTTQDTRKLIYGLDRVDQSQLVYIVEGPLDSLFVKNAVASGDSNLIQVAKALSAAQIVLVYDNEPRHHENIQQIEKAIQLGYSVVIWPTHIHEKDINAMVLAGRTPSDIEDILKSHTYQGLTALTHLSFWKKITPRKGASRYE
jgi:hypothetical protein